ncbi:MAG: hypothetical protein QOC92_4491 [Acidimicrobiaceae bacterium]|jgi:hypothetical protein
MGFPKKYATEEEALKGRRMLERQRSLRHLYGIDLVDYDAMFAAQGGRCAICPATSGNPRHPDSPLHVDHDHETGEVRGLLCTICNKALAFVEASGFEPLQNYLASPPARGVLAARANAAALITFEERIAAGKLDPALDDRPR